MFGLSKLWSWVVVIAMAVALAGGLYWYVFQRGATHAEGQVAVRNQEVMEIAGKATDKAVAQIIRETRTIEHNTQEIKEVIREVPETGLNPISRARLERVRQQQQAAREADSDAVTNLTDVSDRADSAAN